MKNRLLITATISAVLVAAGCGQEKPKPLARSAGISVQSSPTYQLAIADYKAKSFHESLYLIDGLMRNPAYQRSDDHDFLLRQDAICRQALHLPVPVAVSSVKQVSPHGPAQGQDCGPRALLLVCRRLKVSTTLQALTAAAGTSASGTSLKGLINAAHAVGLKSDGIQADEAALGNLHKPAVAWVDGDHYVAVLSVSDAGAVIHDPNRASEETIPIDNLWGRSAGILIELSR